MNKTVLACLVLPALAAMGAEKPNFTGEWKMNAARSDFGALPAPSSMTRSIEHNEPKLRVVTVQSGQRGEVRSEYKYEVDGKEHVNASPGGEVRSVLRWEGNALRVDSERTAAGTKFKTSDRWTLSEDGRTLTAESRLTTPRGEVDLRIVFEKQ